MGHLEQKQEDVEKRKYDRYRIGYGSIVVFNKPILFKLKNRVIKIGPLFDISKGGISVTYVEDQIDFEDVETVSLVNWGEDIKKIENLPVTLIRDEVVGKESGKTVRKRSMRFGELTGYQKARIAYFLHLLNETEDENTTDISDDNIKKFYHV